MLKRKLISITTIFVIIFFLFISVESLLAQEVNMPKHRLYDKIILLGKQKDWKMCFLDSDNEGNNIMRVKYFNTGKILTIYKFSANNLVGLLPSISNHGDKIGFWLNENSEQHSLYIINVDGSNLEKIINVVNGNGVSWSPDDQKIAFSGCLSQKDILEEGVSLYTVDIKTKEIKTLIGDYVGGITNQSWSPDGNKILYGYKGDIISYNLSTNKSYKIARGDMYAWSPGGNRIAYLHNGTLMICKPNGKKEKSLAISKVTPTLKRTHFNKDIVFPPFLWLPVEDYILYARYLTSDAEVGHPFVIELSTGEEEEIPDYGWTFSSWAKGENKN